MALKVHHTQNKLAASLGLTIAHGEHEGEFALVNSTGVMVSHGPDLKALLAAEVKAAAVLSPKATAKPRKAAAPKKARKAAKRKARRSSDDEDGDEGDEPEPASVVKAKYKARYAKSEIRGTNDDAFAAAFRAATINDDGDLDMARVARVARVNSVDMSAYKTTGRGWQGRQRMTLGNMLRAKVRHGVDVEIGTKSFKGDKVEPKVRKARAKKKS